uniref:Uncharacterized protein n=1 Tax=Phlebotomus papatasi TaxID=29031 RepID=A0A1B0DN95_PHLPP
MTDDFQNAGSSMTQGSDENHSVPSGNHSGSIEEYDEDDHTMATTLVYTDPTPESAHELSYRIHKGDEDENKDEDDMTENEDDQHVTATTDLEDVDESIEVIDDLDEKLDDWPKSTSDEDELNHKPDYSHYDDTVMVETTKTPYENDYSEEFYDDSTEVSSHTSKFEDKSTNIPIISTENYHEEHTHLEHINEDQKERYSEDFEEQHQRTTTESYQEHTTVIYDVEDDYVGIIKGADHYETTTNDEEPIMITESFGVYEYYPREQEATTEEEDLSATDDSRKYEDIQERIGMIHEENIKSNEEIAYEHSESTITTEDYFINAKNETYQDESTTEDYIAPSTTEKSKDYENYPREQETTTEEEDSTVTYRSQEYGDIEEKIHMIHEENLEFGEETVLPIATESYPKEQEATTHQGSLSSTDRSKKYEDIEQRDDISHNEELKSDEDATNEENYSPNATEDDFTVTTDEAYRSETASEVDDMLTTTEESKGYENYPSEQETITYEGDPTETDHSKEYGEIEERVGINLEEELKSDENVTYQDNTGTTEEAYKYESTTRDEETTTTNEQPTTNERYRIKQETTKQEDDSIEIYKSKVYEDSEERVGMIYEEKHESDEESKPEENKLSSSVSGSITITTDEPYRYESTTEDDEGPTTKEDSSDYKSHSNDQEATIHEDDSIVTYKSREYENIEERVGMIHEDELEYNEDAANEDNEYPNASEDVNTSTTEETHWYDTITKDRDTTTTNDQSTAFEEYPSEEEVTTQEDDSAIADRSREYENIEDRVGMSHEEEGTKNRDNEYPNASEDDNTSATEETYWYDTTTRDRYTATTNEQSTTYDKYPSEQVATAKEDDSFVTDRSKEYEDNEERVGMINEEELKPNEGATNEDNEYPNASEDDTTSTTEEAYRYDTTIPSEHFQEEDSTITYRTKEYEDIEERGGMIHEEEFETDTDTTAGEHESPGDYDHTSPTEEAYRYETTTDDEDRSTVKKGTTAYESYTSDQKETTLEEDSVGTESDEYFNDRIRIAPEDYYYSTKESTNDENTSTTTDEDVSTATALGDNQYETTEGKENSSSATEKSVVYESSSEEKETFSEEDIYDRNGMIQDKEYGLEEETTNYENESTTTVAEDDYTSTSDSPTATYEEGSSVTEYNRENEDIEERQDMIGEDINDSDEETKDHEYKVTTAAKEENYYTVENEGEEIASGYDVDEDHRSVLGKSQQKESTFVTDGSTKYEVIEDRIGETPEDKYELEEVASSDGNEYLEKELTTDEYTEKSAKSDDVYKSSIEDQEDSTSTAQEEDSSQAKMDTDLKYEDYKGGIYSTVNTESANENEDSNGTTTEEMIRTTEKEDTSSEKEHMVEEIEGRIQNSDEDDKSFLEVVANPEVDEHETMVISTTEEEDQVTTTEEGSVTDRKVKYEDFVADKETYRDVESTTQIEEKPHVMRIPPREPHDLHLVGESYEDTIPDNQGMTESEQVSEETFNQDPTGGYDDDEKKDPGSVSVEGSTTTESGSNSQDPNNTTEENLDVSGQTTTKRNKLSSQPTKPRKSLVKKIKEEINSRLGI